MQFGDLKITSAISEDSGDDIPLMDFLKRDDMGKLNDKADKLGNDAYESDVSVACPRRDLSTNISHLSSSGPGITNVLTHFFLCVRKKMAIVCNH